MALVRATATGLSLSQRPADATRQVDRGRDPELPEERPSTNHAPDAASKRDRGLDAHAENGMGALSAQVVTGF